MGIKASFAACLLALFIVFPFKAKAFEREICPGYKIIFEKRIKFNANEKKLICGDPNAASWSKIPRFEAEYFIKTFLQDRGYFFPEFAEEDETVIIHPGKQAHVRKIHVEGSPPRFFDVRKRRKIKGKVLNPAVLDELENWTASVLKNNGYACPEVRTEADPLTEEVRLKIDPGLYQEIIEVDEEPVEGLRPGTLKRYRAFNIGDPYNAQNLSLTSNRIEYTDGILQSSYFTTECTPEGAKLTQKSLTGPRRLINIGIGASTEDYIIGKLLWRWVRIGKNGSSMQLAVRGSYRQQTINAEGFFYPLPFPSPWYLNPFINTGRRNEKRYEYTAFDFALPAAVKWDTQNAGFRIRFGPKFNTTYTTEGADKGRTNFISGNIWFDVTSHDYEYYAADPRGGYYLNAVASFNSDKVGSSVTAQKMQVIGQAIWNLAGFEPPLFVLAVRGMAGTTFADTGGSSFSRLPPQFFYFLGGSMSLRGFSRFELPSANRGALTALYGGAELRLANVLPLNIQPLAFIDVGVMGRKSLNLDYPVYWSPGFGVRWPSLIGVIRLTYGHGYMIKNNNPNNNSLSHRQFYFSYGEEF